MDGPSTSTLDREFEVSALFFGRDIASAKAVWWWNDGSPSVKPTMR
jgi:hypothetical protein